VPSSRTPLFRYDPDVVAAKLDVTALVFIILTFIAAAAAAVFGYPTWKASRVKPDVRLIVQAGPPTSAMFYLVLSNEGEGAAADWKLTLTMPRESRRFGPADALDPGGVPGWARGEIADSWVATWMSTGANDTIGSGLHRSMMIAAAGSPVTFDASYAIQATGMKKRTGQFRVSIGEDPDRKQSIWMT